ncbi:Acyl-CoA synthetase member 2 mitochondrial [Apiospora hydei]|uniref:Acyl-CoA synthetase member 2 mitochondrial n=1 Tax=Apiospora hydei TaxID=1337664 RepID=A0ABR1VTB4_9PEZI
MSGGSLSYSEGLTEPPLSYDTISDHFASIVSQHGDRPAVMCRAPTRADLLSCSQTATGFEQPPHTEILTYEGLDVLSNRLAHALRSTGVRKGDRVAVSLGNVAENAALTYAVFKLGAILVPLNPSFNQTQLTAALAHLGARTLVIGAVTDLPYKPCLGRSNLPLLEAFIPDMAAPGIASEQVPTLESVIIVDNRASHPKVDFPLEKLRALTPLSELLSSSASSSSAHTVFPDSPLSADETINIQFTSGTTSLPKAAQLSHTCILNNGRLIAARMGLDPADRVVVPPPLFHCFGCVLGYMATATTGAAILFPSPAFDPAASLLMASEQDATGLYGVATMFVAELELLESSPALQEQLQKVHPARLPFRALRKGIAAGSSVPESLMRRLYATLGLEDLVICYGQTETSPVSLMTSPADPIARRTGTVGRAMPHTAVKVVDPTDRTVVLPRGRRGELAASGYLVMQGYWNDPSRTREDCVAAADSPDGRAWMYSGDEARMDEEGYVEITGRIKDLIIRGGENIHPLEVEDCLLQCPGVGDVSVVGVPDARYGEVVGAFVVPHAGWTASVGEGKGEGTKGEGKAKNVLREEDLKAWVREKLSSHLVPSHVWFVDDYPKTASGKIQKFKLRDMAVRLLGRHHHRHEA